jgi:predicted N-acetyltransferase YhbS
MKLNIRQEEPKDFFEVENLTREAFWNLYKPGCNEHFIVRNLRNHSDYLAELSFVLESDGVISGSIFYSKSKIIHTNGIELETITFGPVCIHPALHRKGLGRMLITHSIEKAKKLNHNAILIGGFPYHYKTYGFVGAKKYNIAMPDGQFYTGIMALPLRVGALDGIQNGILQFSDAFEPNEDSFETFDSQFTPKDKMVTPSQAEFEQAVSEIDTNEY